MKKYERYLDTVLVFAAAYATEHSTEPKHLLSGIGIMVEKDEEAVSARDLVLAFKKDDFNENDFIDAIDWLNEDDSEVEDETICQSEEPVETILPDNYHIGDPIIVKDHDYKNNKYDLLGFFAGICPHHNESSALVAVASDYMDLDNTDKYKYYKFDMIEHLTNDYIKDHRSIFADMPNIERSAAVGDIVLIKDYHTIWLGYFNGPLSDSLYIVVALSYRVGQTYYRRTEDKYAYEPLGVCCDRQSVHFINNVAELAALLKEDTATFHIGDPVLITYDDCTMLGIFDGVRKTQQGYFNITVEPTPFKEKGINCETNAVVHNSKVKLLNDKYINTLIEESQDRCGIGSIVLVKTEDFTFLGYYNGIEPLMSTAEELVYNVVPTDDLIGKTYTANKQLPIGSPYKAKYVTFVKDLETLKSLI